MLERDVWMFIYIRTIDITEWKWRIQVNWQEIGKRVHNSLSTLAVSNDTATTIASTRWWLTNQTLCHLAHHYWLLIPWPTWFFSRKREWVDWHCLRVEQENWPYEESNVTGRLYEAYSTISLDHSMDGWHVSKSNTRLVSAYATWAWKKKIERSGSFTL